MKTNIIILGAGGHAKVLLDCLSNDNNINVIGLVDINPENIGREILGSKVLGNEDILVNFPPGQIMLINGVGSSDLPEKRASLYQKFKDKNYQFFSVIHPTAYIGKAVELGEGVQLMAGTIIQPNCQVGANTIINTGARIDHDCVIEQHVHISPGALLAGNVSIEQGCHIGLGSVLIQGIHVGEHALIGAGSVVIRNIQSRERVAGVPAKSIQSIKEDSSHGKLEKHFN